MKRSNSLFEGNKPVIGVLHLPPLPGSPGFKGPLERLLQRAMKDGETLARWGMDGILVENFGDMPFYPDKVPPHVPAILSVICRELKQNLHLPLGVNILRNDAEAALAAATASGADFIRVNVHTGVVFSDQGILEGKAHKTIRYRDEIGSQVKFLCDVQVKHATTPDSRPIALVAEELVYRGLADGLIVTGPKTGAQPNLEDLKKLRKALPDVPLFAGSGITPKEVVRFLPHCDGIIVGTALERETDAGRRISSDRVRIFMKRVKEARK